MFMKAFGFVLGALTGLMTFFFLFFVLLVVIGTFTEVRREGKAEDAAYKAQVDLRKKELCKYYNECHP